MGVGAKERAAKTWFGYGRWEARYWFIGMEPGGTDHAELYTSWDACGGGQLIDAKCHEDEWNRRVGPELRTRYFAEVPRIQKSTWQPLIHILLGFTGRNEDPHHFQRDQWGSANGDVALIELSPIASRSLSASRDRERYQSGRIEAIRGHLENVKPKPALALFYGKSFEKQYSQIAGGAFDGDGVRWNGATLCALTPHPSRPTRSYVHWTEYGRMLRKIADNPQPG
ncbi:MAG: hypothetical protein M3M96_02755 [Candidatus Eremiobacteraeota bacterium]|nr:hypothetical protein [Candidatus Eremiobacteraeota bacterium]